MRERGRTLLEMMGVVLIMVCLLALGLPGLRAYSEQAELLGAAEVFKQEFRKARSIATSTGRQTAIRFEDGPGGPFISVYKDGEHNGILQADIQRGREVRVSGPRRLSTGAASVRIAILPGTPAPPPDHGELDTADPIRFGRGNMVSFTPLGGATPGTLYLAGASTQAAVRVNGMTGGIRVLIRHRGAWREQ